MPDTTCTTPTTCTTTTPTCTTTPTPTCTTTCTTTPPTCTTHCLCTLPPNPHPYTCLSLYAVSVVPTCPRCSGPCTNRIQNGTYSFQCGDTDPFFRLLLLATILLCSCSPDVCAEPLHTELVKLQTALAFDATATECVIEQKTTYVYSAVDRWTSRIGVQRGSAYIRLGLQPFALGGLADRVLDRLASGGACSATCASTTAHDVIRDQVVLDRFLFLVYQQLKAVLRHLDIAVEVTQMNANALQYAAPAQGGCNGGGGFGGSGGGWWSLDEDTPSPTDHYSTPAPAPAPAPTPTPAPALAAVQSHLRILTHLQTQYRTLCADADKWLDGCTNCTTSTTSTSLTTLSAQWIPIARKLRCLAEHIRREEFRTMGGIGGIGGMSCQVDVLHDTVLEQQMRVLAIEHVRLCANQHLDTSLTSIRSTYFGGCSVGTCSGGCAFACNPLVGCMLKERVGGLRRWVGLGDGVRWACGYSSFIPS